MTVRCPRVSRARTLAGVLTRTLKRTTRLRPWPVTTSRPSLASNADDGRWPPDDEDDDDPDASKAAVTAVTGPTASVHVAALEQALRHPAKCDPASGVAVRVWRAPKSRRTVQLPPQSIDPPWTRPEPLPAFRMWKRTVIVGGTWAMAGCWPSKPIAAHRARSAVTPQALPVPKSHGRYHAGGSCGESGLVSAAARLTSVPRGKSAKHSVSTAGSPSPRQSRPAGVLVTRPLPRTLTDTRCGVKTATIDCRASAIVSVQTGPVGQRSSLQRTNDDGPWLVSAEATRVT